MTTTPNPCGERDEECIICRGDGCSSCDPDMASELLAEFRMEREALEHYEN